MEIRITKSAKQFGYVIWNAKIDATMRSFLNNATTVALSFNGIQLGEKRVDWAYHRISIGYKFTRGLSAAATVFYLSYTDGVLEVTTNG